MSSKIFPLDAEVWYEYAFALLEEKAYLQKTGSGGIEKSIESFKKSIGLNPLYFQAYFSLGKIFQLNPDENATLLDDSLKWMKRAAFIRGNQARLSIEVIKNMLSLWPFLENSDREFCRQLIDKSIHSISRGEFISILQAWGQYSRDPGIFKKALAKKREYYRDLANQMTLMELDLKARQDFLSGYEAYYLGYLENKLTSLLEKSDDLTKTYRSAYSNLKTGIPGYYRMKAGSDFDENNFYQFVKMIQFKILDLAFEKGEWRDSAEKKNELEKCIFSAVGDMNLKNDLEDLYQFLKDRAFFENKGLQEQGIELAIWDKIGDRDRLIEKGEEIRNSFSFIREQEKRFFIKVLLILAENYIDQNQFEKAEEVLQEAEKIESENEEMIWLRCRMEKNQGLGDRGLGIGEPKSEIRNPKFETGRKKEGSGERSQKPEERISKTITNTNTENVAGDSEIGDRESDSENKCEQVKNSRIFELKSPIIKKIVYLMDDPILVIYFSEAFKQKLKNKHLLQVFCDGWICFEQYLGRVKEKVEVKVEGGEWKKVEAEVRIQ